MASSKPATAPNAVASPLDILLVNLPYFDHLYYPAPQQGLLSIAASLKQAGYRVGVFDHPESTSAELVALVRQHRPQLIGYHVATDYLPRVRRAIALLRRENLAPELTLVGGPHVSVEDAPLLLSKEVDIVVRGEGEATVIELMQWWHNKDRELASIAGITYQNEKGEIERTPDRPFIEDLDRLPFPDHDVLLSPPRFKTLGMITGRGCPFSCAFCAEGLSGIRYRFRSAESVLQEIRQLVGDRPRAYLGILDDTFLVHRPRVEQIAEGMKQEYAPGQLRWFCEGRVDFILQHRDLIPHLVEAGLARIQIGVESGSQQVLDAYRKEIRVEQIVEAVEILRDAGVTSIYGNFIIGGAMESEETLAQSSALARKLIKLAPGRMECAASILGLYPGTAIAERPVDFGLSVIDPHMKRCLSLQHPVAETASLTATDILAAYDRFCREVMLAYEETLPRVHYDQIDAHLHLQDYDLTTRWAELFARYPCLKGYHNTLKQPGYYALPDIPEAKLLNMVPQRTARVLDADKGKMVVLTHPRKVTFNPMAEEIYQLCSGKQTVAEVIELLSERCAFLPPRPILEHHVIEVMRDMDRKRLLVFSEW